MTKDGESTIKELPLKLKKNKKKNKKIIIKKMIIKLKLNHKKMKGKLKIKKNW